MEHSMSRRPRRNHSPDFKAKVAFAAIKGDHTLAELSAEFDIHANQILDWKNQLLSQSARVFESTTSKPEPEVDLKLLHAKIGHQALQIDFLESALSKAGILSASK
jgi:transposase